MPDTGRPQVSQTGERLAEVHRLLMAHRIRPDETLAVRLLGSVGPDGSYTLDAVDERREADRVTLLPRVRRTPGDAFIQMLIPLDRTVHLQLPPGRHRIEVQGSTASLRDSVVVAPDVVREPPTIHLEATGEVVAGAERVVTLRVEARAGDGFVDRVEWRAGDASSPGAWSASEFEQRTTIGMEAVFTVRRPADDAERRVEARALDGQGARSPIAAVVLPRR